MNTESKILDVSGTEVEVKPDVDFCEMPQSDVHRSPGNVSEAGLRSGTGDYQSAIDLNALGLSHLEQFRDTRALSDLDEAIRYFTRALTLTPEGDANIELADLEKAIECFTHALALTPDGYPDLSGRHAELGVSYTYRYRRLGELADLEKAIECDTCALALTPHSHPHISRRHAELGATYTHRYRRLGDPADLEKAIECLSHALALTPNGHPDLSRRHADLGVSYIDRYRSLRSLADLQQAIECYTRALALTPNGHPDMSRRHSNLGASCIHRYQHLGELADLEKAIEYHTRALALTPDGHRNISSRYASLGSSYTHRYRHLGEIADLEKAIECDTQALALTPEDHPDFPSRSINHAISLLGQYDRTGRFASLIDSLHSFRKASQLLTGGPRQKFQHALYWAGLASKQSLLNPIEAYQTAIDLLPQFIWLGATTNQRYQDLLLTENLAVKACLAAIQSSNHSLALEWLEHARCVVWNQSLMLRSPLDELYLSYPDLATRLKSISSQLHSAGFDSQPVQSAASHSMTSEQSGQQRRRLASEYLDLLAHTRQIPGFESFSKPLKAKTIISAVRNGPVVVLNCHADSCDALVIMPGYEQITHLPLPNFTENKARWARSQLETSLEKRGQRQRGVKLMHEISYQDSFERVLGTLWSDIVQLVLDHLGYLNNPPRDHLPHITWCPTGLLTFLPLHAAGDYSQPQSRVFNHAISSYIPTLTALLTSAPSQFNRSCRVLAIGQATTAGQNPLPGTTEELAHVKARTHDRAEYSQLIDSQATTAAVLDAMELHDWVHLACHANQDVKDPIKSGFHLHDGTLDLSAINRRSFKNKGLAFLSACQTATGDENLPDEAIHLASGMLMAGYPSVIATMWSVDDRDAPFVADKVYAQLMKDGTLGNGEAGRALQYAVKGLREQVGEKEFGRWVPYIHIGS
ncbi:aromatic di-alanine and TPR containing protein [Rhizoctonia solani 123E]|uniref:Aromatic di-alanine and TPR containing protein n=1 Tax=Rhizoctonia solani 123E TaxID=1423351 RepID=A0A074RIH0_9AGAM|nr:aromatic di-alanine and TPR containing protein [Rhizoctonia solani 123E]